MKIDGMLGIFNFENIPINEIDEDHFEEKHGLYESFHKLECREGVWSLVLEIWERRHDEKIERTFNNKDEAIRYFCFYKLERKYFTTYLRRVINDNYYLGRDGFTLVELLNLFNQLGIEKDLYGFDSYKGNAINLIDERNGKYIIVFLDEKKDVILKTRKLERAESLFFMFEMVYMLHIMKTHAAEMQKVGLLTDGVSTEDYKILLS